MIHETIQHIAEELYGMPDVADVKIGVPHEPSIQEDQGGSSITVFLTFLNLESIDRHRKQAKIRVMLTAYYPDAEAGVEDVQVHALEALDHIIQYLSDRQQEYVLIATPDHAANNIWSSLRMGLRPFLVYECQMPLSQ